MCSEFPTVPDREIIVLCFDMETQRLCYSRKTHLQQLKNVKPAEYSWKIVLKEECPPPQRLLIKYVIFLFVEVRLKQTPDPWSVRERLALACSVLRSGDQNW